MYNRIQLKHHWHGVAAIQCCHRVINHTIHMAEQRFTAATEWSTTPFTWQSSDSVLPHSDQPHHPRGRAAIQCWPTVINHTIHMAEQRFSAATQWSTTPSTWQSSDSVLPHSDQPHHPHGRSAIQCCHTVINHTIHMAELRFSAATQWSTTPSTWQSSDSVLPQSDQPHHPRGRAAIQCCHTVINHTIHVAEQRFSAATQWSTTPSTWQSSDSVLPHSDQLVSLNYTMLWDKTGYLFLYKITNKTVYWIRYVVRERLYPKPVLYKTSQVTRLRPG